MTLRSHSSKHIISYNTSFNIIYHIQTRFVIILIVSDMVTVILIESADVFTTRHY